MARVGAQIGFGVQGRAASVFSIWALMKASWLIPNALKRSMKVSNRLSGTLFSAS